MNATAHLEARRTAQAIARLWRHVRRLRQRGRMTEADAEVRAFEYRGVAAVPSGLWRQWMELRDATERLRAYDPTLNVTSGT